MYSVGLLLALLSTTTETQDQVKGGLLLDVVVGQRAAILELLASKNQALLVRRDAALESTAAQSSRARQRERTPPYPGSSP